MREAYVEPLWGKLTSNIHVYEKTRRREEGEKKRRDREGNDRGVTGRKNDEIPFDFDPLYLDLKKIVEN